MPKAWPVFLTAFFFFFTPVIPLFAQVKINEFSSETSADWVELYSTEDVDISGWILRDTANSRIETIPKGTKIGPATNKFFVIGAGNRLNKDEDSIKLYREDDSTAVDQISYGPNEDLCAPEAGQTAGRQPDGTDKITRFIAATEWQANPAEEIACPSPSPSPSPNPSASPTPSANSSSSNSNQSSHPSPSPTPNYSPSPSPSTSPSPKPTTRLKNIVLLTTQTPEPVLGTSSAAAQAPADWQLVIILLITGSGILAATSIIIVRLWRKS
jgi:hypothetical protein